MAFYEGVFKIPGKQVLTVLQGIRPRLPGRTAVWASQMTSQGCDLEGKHSCVSIGRVVGSNERQTQWLSHLAIMVDVISFQESVQYLPRYLAVRRDRDPMGISDFFALQHW